jgi:hypothetical protein
MSDIIKYLKKSHNNSYSMLEEMIEICPDYLWDKKAGGFVFWQQIMHALVGSRYWMREPDWDFKIPYKDKNLHLELNGEPEENLSKEQVKNYWIEAKKQTQSIFDGKDSNWLQSNCFISEKMKNIDVILEDIRHIQYHVGHCNSILREHNEKAVDWI